MTEKVLKEFEESLDKLTSFIFDDVKLAEIEKIVAVAFGKEGIPVSGASIGAFKEGIKYAMVSQAADGKEMSSTTMMTWAALRLLMKKKVAAEKLEAIPPAPGTVDWDKAIALLEGWAADYEKDGLGLNRERGRRYENVARELRMLRKEGENGREYHGNA